MLTDTYEHRCQCDCQFLYETKRIEWCALCVCDFVLVEIRRNSITLSGTGTNMFVLKRLKCQTINITSNIDCNKSKTRGEFRNFVSIYERGIEKNIKLLVNHSLE